MDVVEGVVYFHDVLSLFGFFNASTDGVYVKYIPCRLASHFGTSRDVVYLYNVPFLPGHHHHVYLCNIPFLTGYMDTAGHVENPYNVPFLAGSMGNYGYAVYLHDVPLLPGSLDTSGDFVGDESLWDKLMHAICIH